MKHCYKCNRYLLESKFSKNKHTKDGLALPCKSCVKTHDASYYLNNKNKKIESSIKWMRENPERHKELARIATKRRRLKDLEKARKYGRERASEFKYPHVKKAGRIVYKAIKSGKLQKTCCLICTKLNKKLTNMVEAHHSDYSKPLEVTWMCKRHHSAWHRLFLPELPIC